MPEHDAIQSNVIDDGLRVACRCGRTFTGPDARERHADHHTYETGIAAARQALKGETDE
jgi:hypothetical protein